MSAKIANVLFPLLFSLCTVAVLIAFVWLMVRVIGKDNSVPQNDGGEKALNFTVILPVLLVVGLILRLIFVFAVKGYRPEFKAITDELFVHLDRNGFGGNYYTTYGTEILPVTYYIYALMGAVYNLFGLASESVAAALFVKLPLIAADLITAFLLYKLAKRYMNVYAAIVVAGFVCIFPVFIFASSVWATQYSLLTVFLVLSLYFLVQKNFIALTGCYAAALLTHKDAAYLFPLVAVFLIYNFVKSVLCVRAAKPASAGAIFKDSATRPVFTVPIAIAGFLLLSYLVALPLMIGSYGAGFFTFIYRLYLKPLASFDTFGNNSLGIFNLFMRNGKALNSRFPSVVFTVLFGVIVTGIVLLVYLSKKNRANLVYLAAYIIFTLATYFIGFTEFSLLAVLAILLMSFYLVRDKRILAVFAVLSLVVIINASCVMASAGYYNTLADYYVGLGETVNPNYTGSLLLQGGARAITVVCSALAVLTHLYATVVLLDISMSNKRKILPYIENASFGKALAAFCKFRNK